MRQSKRTPGPSFQKQVSRKSKRTLGPSLQKQVSRVHDVCKTVIAKLENIDPRIGMLESWYNALASSARRAPLARRLVQEKDCKAVAFYEQKKP